MSFPHLTNTFNRLVRFIPRSSQGRILIGQPVSEQIDVGLALYNGEEVEAEVFSGVSILECGRPTGVVEKVQKVLSPLAAHEVGTIRCIGLNYTQHAKEVGLDLPTEPTVFMKPSTTVGNPWPAPIPIPKITQADDCGDYESELAVIIGKEGKNIPESEAMNYVLGYTAANDVSSRSSQFSQSQWCFSKGFDGACPIGPALVSTQTVPDPSSLHIRGIHNGNVVQDCGIDDLIFTIPRLVSFLSQGTTLLPGTVIITGTPAGVGVGKKPKLTVKHDDEFRVEVLPHVGTLINRFENE